MKGDSGLASLSSRVKTPSKRCCHKGADEVSCVSEVQQMKWNIIRVLADVEENPPKNPSGGRAGAA
jgi:hypothetical protein